MREYGKVFTSIWSSPTFRSLSEDGRHLAMYLLTSPHTTMIGAFRLPDGYVCEDLQWGYERVSKGFDNLHSNGFATRDEASKWVVIHNYLEWNEIENPNQAKSAIKLLDAIPDIHGHKQELARVLAKQTDRFMDKLDATYINRLETLAKGFLNQEQEQEQDIKEGTDVPSVASQQADDHRVPACPQQKLLDLYAAILPEFPQPRVWEGARADAMRKRWRWVLTATKRGTSERYAETQEQGIEFFTRFFRYVRECPFLMGKTGWNGCDLPWLMKSENFDKVLSGKYDNLEKAA